MKKTSATQFALALKRLEQPKDKQLRFLRAHYTAKGRAMTASLLADKVGYKDYRGINLWYGRLARQLGPFMGVPDASLSLLVEFAAPKTITNKHWILFMRPEFAQGLEQAEWV